MVMPVIHFIKWLSCLLFVLSAASLRAHELGITGERPLDWHTNQISQVIAGGNSLEAGRVVTLNGERCLEGSYFNFNVRDQYAFDVDEPVQLEVEFYLGPSDTRVAVVYERNDEGDATVEARIPAYKEGNHQYKSVFALSRARFANQGRFNSDFAIGAPAAWESPTQRLAICKISLSRSYKTQIARSSGQFALEVTDETGELTPVRGGLYDATGRLPLPGSEAVSLKRFNYEVRSITLSSDHVPWPARNRSVFYIDGSYHAKLPTGKYELVIAKGLEYRIVRRAFTVERDKTRAIRIKLQRWANLPAKGWVSGDDHIHYARNDQNDDRSLLRFAAAEDLHVANILQMGNIATTYYRQYNWVPVSAAREGHSIIVPGQEDPRTFHRGHTIHLNLREPVHPEAERYLLYDETFARTRAQGAVVGYAHVIGSGDAFGVRKGMALDIPFGLIDFVEVMQAGVGGSDAWFDFLNLGYKLSPAAGTDYPYGNIPGAERSYVHVVAPFTAQSWFDGLKRGETFVTNGPVLEFSVNGQGMGSELSLKSGEKLVIDVKATMNPDIDSIDKVELIEQGEVISSVRSKGSDESDLQLHYETTARNGTWFVVRAYGKKQRKAPDLVKAFGEGASKMAVSGAVYVSVDGQKFWKPSAVPVIVDRLKQGMQKLMSPQRDWHERSDTQKLDLQHWDAQKEMLRQRIDRASAIYDDLVKRASQ